MAKLTITTPAPDRSLLTLAEMRDAIGSTPSDAALTALGLRVSDSICAYCNVARGLSYPPTLRRETLTETFSKVSAQRMILARRHDVVVSSFTLDDDAVDAEDFVVDSEAGTVERGEALVPAWQGTAGVIVYEAGFEIVPGELKQAALDLFRATYYAGTRDPMLRGHEVDIPGLGRERQDFWVGSAPGQSGSAGGMPPMIAAQLERYRNFGLA